MDLKKNDNSTGCGSNCGDNSKSKNKMKTWFIFGSIMILAISVGTYSFMKKQKNISDKTQCEPSSTCCPPAVNQVKSEVTPLSLLSSVNEIDKIAMGKHSLFIIVTDNEKMQKPLEMYGKIKQVVSNNAAEKGVAILVINNESDGFDTFKTTYAVKEIPCVVVLSQSCKPKILNEQGLTVDEISNTLKCANTCSTPCGS